jgi:uncharacterized protein YcbK (DUF882 family)
MIIKRTFKTGCCKIFNSYNKCRGLHKTDLDRRRFLKVGTMTTVCGLLPIPVSGAIQRLKSPTRNISLYNTHTNESLDVCYCRHGKYLAGALKAVNHIMRDHRTGDIKSIDPRLIDYLYAIANKLQVRVPFHIISGYRSPATNSLLRKRSKRVAKNSLHVKGQAIDIRLPGSKIKTLRRVAVDLKRGGVGYYPRYDFVHVDVGPLRYW